MAILSNTRQILQHREVGSIKTTREFSLRPFAQNQHVLGIATGDKRTLQASKQGHDENRGGHGERDAQRCHDRQALA